MTFDEVYRELLQYYELSPNWDGYGGFRPSLGILNTTKIFLDILYNKNLPAPRIMVSGDNSIGLFWKNKDQYLEINFDKTLEFTFFIEDSLECTLYGLEDIPLFSNTNIYEIIQKIRH